MADLSAIILTKNEELNIAKCINSISGVAKRIIVVDSGSTDKTIEIATELGAEVIVNKPEKFYYAQQFLLAMEKAEIDTKWVLRIDADEELSPEAAKEINDICDANADTDVNGIVVRFKVNFMGRDLKHGGVYPFRKLLVFKYGKGNIEDRKMDEHIVLFEGKSVELKHDSIHHDYKDLTYWISKHNSYASREVEDFINNSENPAAAFEEAESLDSSARLKRKIKFGVYYKLPSGIRVRLYYFYRLILKGAFLDGREGRMYAYLQAYWYRYLVDAKIYEYTKKKGV